MLLWRMEGMGSSSDRKRKFAHADEDSSERKLPPTEPNYHRAAHGTSYDGHSSRKEGRTAQQKQRYYHDDEQRYAARDEFAPTPTPTNYHSSGGRFYPSPSHAAKHPRHEEIDPGSQPPRLPPTSPQPRHPRSSYYAPAYAAGGGHHYPEPRPSPVAPHSPYGGREARRSPVDPRHVEFSGGSRHASPSADPRAFEVPPPRTYMDGPPLPMSFHRGSVPYHHSARPGHDYPGYGYARPPSHAYAGLYPRSSYPLPMDPNAPTPYGNPPPPPMPPPGAPRDMQAFSTAGYPPPHRPSKMPRIQGKASSFGILLATEDDVSNLSEYQHLVRQQLEFFEATEDDVAYTTQGRKKQITVGQVGIRCRHCAHIPLHIRSRGSVYYPARCDSVYQAAQNMATSHLMEACDQMNQAIRDELKRLRLRRDTAAGGKAYWAASCRKVGVDQSEGGLRMKKSG